MVWSLLLSEDSKDFNTLKHKSARICTVAIDAPVISLVNKENSEKLPPASCGCVSGGLNIWEIQLPLLLATDDHTMQVF